MVTTKINFVVLKEATRGNVIFSVIVESLCSKLLI